MRAIDGSSVLSLRSSAQACMHTCVSPELVQGLSASKTARVGKCKREAPCHRLRVQMPDKSKTQCRAETWIRCKKRDGSSMRPVISDLMLGKASTSLLGWREHL